MSAATATDVATDAATSASVSASRKSARLGGHRASRLAANLGAPDDVVQALEASRVFSYEDLLVLPEVTLRKFSAAQKQWVLEAQRSARTQLSGCVLTGLELFLEDSRRDVLSTGIPLLDGLLPGGLATGQVTEIIGGSPSGKTQLCLSIAQTVAASRRTVMFIDTQNNFNSTRLDEIREYSSSKRNGTCLAADGSTYVDSTGAETSLAPEDPVVSMCKVLTGIICVRALDAGTLSQTLFALDSKLGSHQCPCSLKSIRLVILDCISPLLSPLLGGHHTGGHALMCDLGQAMKRIAVQHNIAFLVTNYTVTGPGEPKPALAESWRSIADNRLYLITEPLPPTHQRMTVTLLKCIEAPYKCGECIGLHISTQGITEEFHEGST
ncbi:DNA repair protein RAD51D [Pelomyxa schiedti]|nr:DNA repair protein RAD51D [Pelomyxa schiedti]